LWYPGSTTNYNNSSALKSATDQKYGFYWSGPSLKRIHGVGIAIKVDNEIEMEEVRNVNDRIIVVDVGLHGCLLRIINCYAPTEDSSSSTKDVLFNSKKTV